MRVGRAGRGGPRRRQRMAGDVELGAGRTARELFDRAAVEIARLEIHGREAAFRAQPCVDEADALEEVGPVDVRHQAHAGDHVAHRDVGGSLALLGMRDRVVDGGVLPSEPLLQPAEGRHGVGIVVSQPLGQLCSKELGQRQRRARDDVLLECGPRRARQREAGCKQVGIRPCRAPDRDLVGQPAQVLDEDDAQRDRDGPKLADRQRLDPLVGGDEAAQHGGVDVAVGVRHEGPGQAEDTRVAGERACRELWQLPVVVGGQVAADLADLLLDEVIVVEQPFGGGCDAPARLQLGGAGPVGCEQHPGVVVEPCPQWARSGRPRRDGLRHGQALRVLLQALDAEELFSNRCPVGPWGGWGATPEGEGGKNEVHERLSANSGARGRPDAAADPRFDAVRRQEGRTLAASPAPWRLGPAGGARRPGCPLRGCGRSPSDRRPGHRDGSGSAGFPCRRWHRSTAYRLEPRSARCGTPRGRKGAVT
ncbi:hypothetical protein APY03_7813 [Variovorax sp. WDL1]|nr:hypothetical protein APY03_7813 [Variovorax sp. WDL1]